MPSDATTVGQRMKGWRDSLGLGQRAAAEKAGIKQSAWCQYERDEAVPRADAIEKLIALTAGTEYALSLDMFAEAERARRPQTPTGTG